jgi:hypothetical protein
MLIFAGMKLVFFGKFTDICRGDRRAGYSVKTVHCSNLIARLLDLATSVYPDANVEEASNGAGLILKPSSPRVSPEGAPTSRPRLNLIPISR